MSQTTYGKPPVAKTMRRNMSPRRADVRGLRAPSADMKRSDVIRAGSARPGTPHQTVGDPGTRMSIQTYSAFSEGGLFYTSVIPLRRVDCPMDKSRIAAEVRKNRKNVKAAKEMEHRNAAEEFAVLAAAPKSYLKPTFVQIACASGTVPLDAPDAVLPQRAATPDGLPPRPESRHTTVRMPSTLPLSRPSTAQTFKLSSTPGSSSLPGVCIMGNGNKPPLSRPASAFSTASHKSAASSEYRPLSANPISPQQALRRQVSEVRLNERLRASSPSLQASTRPSTAASEVRPLRSFVS